MKIMKVKSKKLTDSGCNFEIWGLDGMSTFRGIPKKSQKVDKFNRMETYRFELEIEDSAKDIFVKINSLLYVNNGDDVLLKIYLLHQLATDEEKLKLRRKIRDYINKATDEFLINLLPEIPIRIFGKENLSFFGKQS